MTWVQTYTGMAFDLLEPQAEHVVIEDIAHALAQQCRYNGHTRGFYSVAQHSCLVSLEVEAYLLDEGLAIPAMVRNTALWGLLHDAAEAYVGDLIAPMKWLLRRRPANPVVEELVSGFDEIEASVMRVIKRRFGLMGPEPELVKAFDLKLLATERRDLFEPGDRDWHLKYEPLKRKIIPADSGVAETEFLCRFERLNGGQR